MNKILGITRDLDNDLNSSIINRSKGEYEIWEWDEMSVFNKSRENRSKMSAQGYVEYYQENHWSISQFALNVPYNTLDTEGLKSYIHAFEEILNLKICDEFIEFPIKWLTNDAEFRLRAKRKSQDEIALDINCKNKYRLRYDEFDMGPFGGGDPEEYGREVVSEYNGKPEDYSKFAPNRYPVENIERYVEELISEYESVTGKKYERIKK